MSYRTASGVLMALLQRQYYRAAINTMCYVDHPVRNFVGYVTLAQRGFPRSVTVKTPTGRHVLRLYSYHDLVTLVECFAKLDYAITSDARCVVDFGSNIGISAAYFLSRNSSARVYLFEPVPRNIERLGDNLSSWVGRYQLETAAVGTAAGSASFGCEPTGRYGGIGLDLSETITVSVRDANEALRSILAIEGSIDALKVDVEGMEIPILSHLAPDILRRIRVIFAETQDREVALEGFTKVRQGAISIYRHL